MYLYFCFLSSVACGVFPEMLSGLEMSIRRFFPTINIIKDNKHKMNVNDMASIE